MHSGYFDNPEVKKKFGEELARYSPAGVHVDFQILQRLPVSGTIISETSQEHRYGKGAGRSGTFYIVRLDPDYRIHFRNLMKELRLQGDQPYGGLCSIVGGIQGVRPIEDYHQLQPGGIRSCEGHFREELVETTSSAKDNLAIVIYKGRIMSGEDVRVYLA